MKICLAKNIKTKTKMEGNVDGHGSGAELKVCGLDFELSLLLLLLWLCCFCCNSARVRPSGCGPSISFIKEPKLSTTDTFSGAR